MAIIPPLPYELTDRIVDFLHDDHSALFSCAQAHRRLAPSSWTHLFRELRLNMDDRCDLRRLSDAIQHDPSLARRVQELHWSGTWEYPTAWVIKPFTGLESVTALYLTYMHFATFEELTDYVASFPNLHTLHLRSIRCESCLEYTPQCSANAAKLRLQRLYLEDVERRVVDPLQTWLQASPTKEALRVLSVKWMRDRDVELTKSILGWHAGTLDELHIPIQATTDHKLIANALPLSSTHPITTLSISIQSTDYAAVAPLVMSILSTTYIPSVKNIKFEICGRTQRPPTVVTLPAVEFPEHPSFSTEQWPYLRAIELALIHIEKVDNLQVLLGHFKPAERREVPVVVSHAAK